MPSARSLGFDAERLRRIDRHLAERYVEPGLIPCAYVAVERGGEPVHRSILGRRDVERDLPCEEDTIFRIYSMTKPVTSVALMMLFEAGLVALDDPVHKYIPAWRDLGVYKAGTGPFLTERPARPMLVIDLMRHTSGLTYSFQNRTNVDAAYRKQRVGDPGSELDLEGMVEALSRLPLEFSPGSAWNYSVSTDVVGHLVAKISGMAFPEFLRTRILEPLRMTDTGFHVSDGQGERFAACYEAVPGRPFRLQDDPRTSPFLKPPVFYSGGGGLVSTVADYLRFARMLANGGELDGVRVLAPKTLRLMTSNHLPDGRDLPSLSLSLFSETAYSGVGFGLGFAVNTDPARTLMPVSRGEFSWGGMASTTFWVDPVEDVVAVFMTQLMPSSTYPIRRELRTLVYSALMESRA